MLYHLSSGLDKEAFIILIEKIKKSLWPEEELKKHREDLPAWADDPGDEDRLIELRKKVEYIIEKVSKEHQLYSVFGINTSKQLCQIDTAALPFAERYHQYFAHRQWEYPYRDPRRPSVCATIFRLEKLENPAEHESYDGHEPLQNYSKNVGDFVHFINVIAATARLIEYFSDENNISMAMEWSNDSNAATGSKHHRLFNLNNLSYQQFGLRNFKLMLAAYFHDLGKTVENHRHGIEGASILSNHTTEATDLLGLLFNRYPGVNNSSPRFERDDLLQIANLIYYHDQFGMLATGEAGYARLVEIVHRIRRSTISIDIEDQRRWSRWYLFDLWVLNIADIMTSIDNHKTIVYQELYDQNLAKLEIEKFLKSPKANLLRHDFLIALKLMENQNLSQHADDLSVLEKNAMEYAKRHAIERIRRLMIILTVDISSTCKNKFKPTDPIMLILEKVKTFSDAKWNSTISRCIYSLGDYGEFVERFCWIGQMDYAFGFLAKIAIRAMQLVNEELLGCGNCRKTGWVYQPSDEGTKYYPRTELDPFQININTDFYTDNLASTLVQILHFLLFRERETGRLRNLEFWVANQRLTNEKIDRILAQEGPFRTRSSVQLALESIFLW